MTKVTFSIFMSSNKSSFSINLFFIFLLSIKTSKDSSAKYYQDNKERLRKKSHKMYQSLCKKEKEKKRHKIYQKYRK